MASVVDMSLEDIIKKKKSETNRTKGPVKKGKAIVQQPKYVKKIPVTDARYKLLLKRRNQPQNKIVDAREKLMQIGVKRDARAKIEQLKQMRQERGELQTRRLHSSRPLVRTVQNKRVFSDTSRTVSQGNKIRTRRQLNTERNVDRRLRDGRMDNYQLMTPLTRTIRNDKIEIIDDEDDPMGEDLYIPSKPALSNRNANIQMKIITQNETRDKRAFLQRTFVTDKSKEKSPPRPHSILKKRPMVALRDQNKIARVETRPFEYRIIVSNLQSTVSAGDIEELFGDVGGMVESRLVRPGTAEVIYKCQEDAQKAVDLYHNRQLDGQPMTCLLVTPRSNFVPAPSRTGNKPALISSNSNVEPDLSTFHKVLFSNF